MNRFVLFLLSTCTASLSPAEEIDFDRDVRPILSENCFHCHGPDGAAREAELRLDTKEGTLDVVAANRVADSELFSRITSDDVDEQMPPKKTELKLTAKEVETIRQWIEQGAKWTKHWAFVPPQRYEVPEVTKADWPRNTIDHFVLTRLEKENLSPSNVASFETLIRRVTLDLTGFPPTPAEVDAFLADKSAGAYEKVVDRLLKSSHYGERMAWEWLDAARYADTDGFQGDPTRTMWPWRDWLIKALNDNMPFDQFTIEMLAGDLLPGATIDQIIATGFNRNHMHNGEGGRIAEETRVENVFDRAETTSTVWLGLTMTCARCHDHKYDPIGQREYYQLFAFFNNTSESGSRGGGKAPPILRFLPADKRDQIKQLEDKIAELKKMMNSPLPDVDERQAAWELETAQRVAEAAKATDKLAISPWSVLGTLPAPEGNGGKTFGHQYGPEKGVHLARKYADDKIAWRTDEKFVDGKVHPLPETVGSDDGIQVWLNGKEILSKNVARGAAADQERAKLALQEGKNKLLMKITNTGGIGGFYFRIVSESGDGLPADVLAIFQVERDRRNDAQKNRLRDHYRGQFSAEWKKLNAEVGKLNGQRAEIDKSAVMVMDDLAKPRSTKVLFRGIYNKPTDLEVSSGTPSFLPPLPSEGKQNRLALAKWLVDPAHPLTARVTVNRYWQAFFGTGLVRTTEDFGRQGERPTHPQLLDWLATQFIDSGWDVKALHKMIVMSATYRQSSRIANFGFRNADLQADNPKSEIGNS